MYAPHGSRESWLRSRSRQRASSRETSPRIARAASVRIVVAIPLASVVGLPAVRLPPPEASVNATNTPETGLLLAERTITDGGVGTEVVR